MKRKILSAYSLTRIFILVTGMMLVQMSFAAGTMDYYGEINQSEHPAGYQEYVDMGCFQCHGFQGQGGPSPALVSPLFPYEAFANQVRRPRSVMPAYSPNILSEQQLRAIYSYLEKVPASPSASEIPLLSGD